MAFGPWALSVTLSSPVEGGQWLPGSHPCPLVPMLSLEFHLPLLVVFAEGHRLPPSALWLGMDLEDPTTLPTSLTL